MFDLETAISTWRHSLRHTRVVTDEDAEELESHVREQVADLIAGGMPEEEAFRRTMSEMGHPVMAEAEFRKVFWSKLRRRNRLTSELKWKASMLSNFVKTAWRNMLRHKGVAAINLGGLAVALAACILIGHYVHDELSYDSFHEKGDRIFRMGEGTTGWPYGRIIESEYPEVEKVLYMRSYPTMSIEHEGTHHFETMRFAEREFFEFFDVPLTEGDPQTALAAPWSIVLSTTLAERFFGDQQAVGRSLTLQDSLDFTVTGVADVPGRSHIGFEALLSFETLRALWGDEGFEQQFSDGWLNLNVVNYVMIAENTDAEAVEAKIAGIPMELAGDFFRRWGATDYRLELEPVSDIYLHSEYGNPLGPSSDFSYVLLLGGVGLFLLLIAAANFVNLMTARSVERAKEVGIRKSLGSTRAALVQQFLGESFLTATTALVLSLLLVAAFLPQFNDLANRTFVLADLFSAGTIVLLVGLVLAVGLVAGLYPAFSLSRFSPVSALRNRTQSGSGGTRIRRGLVIFQFAISAALIVATLVVLRQVDFMQTRDLGFEPDQVLVLDARQAPGREFAERVETIKQVLEEHPGVHASGTAWATPGQNGWIGQLSFPEGWDDERSISLEYIAVDHDYLSTLGFDIVAGRNFDASRPSDARSAVIINEAAVEAVGWESAESAVGKSFTSPGSGKPDGVVIGVVADYHQRGLQEDIRPIMFGVGSGRQIALRVDPKQGAAVIDHVGAVWGDFFSGYPFRTSFLDERFAAQYDQQDRLARIFGTFSALTVIVGCLGLFGLATFTVARRRKEIGVRKALGASSGQIVRLLSREFAGLVLVAIVLASPLAWLGMRTWLRDFAYRVDVGIMVFLAAGVLVLLIALVTVSYQAVRAASTDPVRSLRYE